METSASNGLYTPTVFSSSTGVLYGYTKLTKNEGTAETLNGYSGYRFNFTNISHKYLYLRCQVNPATNYCQIVRTCQAKKLR